MPSQPAPPGGPPPARPGPPAASAGVPGVPAAAPGLAAAASAASAASGFDELAMLRARLDRLEAGKAEPSSLSTKTKVTLDLKSTGALVAGVFIAAWTASAWVNSKLDAVRTDLRNELASKADVAAIKSDVSTLQTKLDKTADEGNATRVSVGQVQAKLDILIALSQPKK